MNVEISAHSGSTCDEGPLINGRPVLTIEVVQSWCRAASMPGLTNSAAAEMARELNDATLLRAQWAPEFAKLQKANPSILRMRRIASALATLRGDLPGLLDDSRAGGADVSLTEALLDLVQKHESVIDKYRRARGRPDDLTVKVATNIGRMLRKQFTSVRVTAKAHDAFVACAMAWLLPNPPADTTISRNRRRQTKRACPSHLPGTT
jgi:hypothetical protein